jgi:hypothetical protein
MREVWVPRITADLRDAELADGENTVAALMRRRAPGSPAQKKRKGMTQ